MSDGNAYSLPVLAIAKQRFDGAMLTEIAALFSVSVEPRLVNLNDQAIQPPFNPTLTQIQDAIPGTARNSARTALTHICDWIGNTVTSCGSLATAGRISW
jgi:hypothetical protein